MPVIVRWFKKQNSLIISSRDNQNRKKSRITLAAITNIIILNLTKQSFDQHKYSSPPIKISPTNPIPPIKYALERGDFFLTT